MKTAALLIITALGVATLMRQSATKPRGLRNNNPGNLRLTSIPWKGKVPPEQNTDGAFEQFESPAWGVRALWLDVTGKIERRGLDNIAALLSVYAPPSENDTAAYIASVSQSVGIGPEATLRPEHYVPLVQAIIKHENGAQPFTAWEIQQAAAMA